jgi:peptidyl-tRNA hydrolase, PTH1 family
VKVIVGLGNPGGTYQWTRHNIGFQVLDRLAEESHISLGHKRFKAQYGKGFVHSRDVLLVKPLTFMNLSGLAVKRIIHYYKAGPEDLMVIHDDLDLPFGALRIKRWGGDGGHQGVRSIIDSMGGNNFLRLKVGIGRPPRGMDPADYVLRFFDELERRQLEEVLIRAAECLVVMISEGVETAMNRFQKNLILPFQSP